MNNIELVDALKLHLNNGISNEATTILEEAIYRITNIGKYNSKIFKRGTTLTVSSCEQFTISEKSVNDSWEEIRKRENGKGTPTPSFDDDIWDWFKKKTIPAIKQNFTGTIQRFTETVSHRQILDEAEKLSIKKIYSWLEAKRIIHQAILQGEVDVRGTSVIAYFKVEGNDTLYRFSAYRCGGDRLSVIVSGVDLEDKYGAGDGACFSN